MMVNNFNLTGRKPMNLEKTRQLIADRIIDITTVVDKEFDINEVGSIFLAPWDNKRISWEENFLLSCYYDQEPDKFYDILDQACKDTGYFIELINGCEGHLVKQ